MLAWSLSRHSAKNRFFAAPVHLGPVGQATSRTKGSRRQCAWVWGTKNLLHQTMIGGPTIFDQLARTGLLPTDLADEILAGKLPPTSEVTLHLVIAAMDAHAMTDGDPKSSWTERRISRQNLGLTFLMAIAI